ncbi:MAG: DUF5615 family PIN-like protein [Chloroflexota bacterium]|nr:DUF5615 family PIN-like protein [Chloroflexota bacterium]MDE2960294.1 DUF5615 family PIN-like protein [Chloroflexota bacterium]
MDRCAGRRLAEWLRNGGHDALEAQTIGPDPGDQALLELAASENRVLITIDKDFGELIYLHRMPHAGLIRLPDVRMARRIEIIAEIIDHYSRELEEHAVITVHGGHVRVSRPPTN